MLIILFLNSLSITLSPANITQSSLSTLEVSPQTRSNFVYVPQGNTLFSGTIRDNLLMGNPHATEAEMLQALRTACADFVLSLPDGIEQLIKNWLEAGIIK